MAGVTHSGHLSAIFLIFCGTRQEFPLLLTIFILALEPLAIALRDYPNISGILYASTHHETSLFADDALFTLTNPLTNLPNLQALLSHFSAFSGFHVNPYMTTALNISLPTLHGDPATSLLSVSLEFLLPGLPWHQADPSLLIPLCHQLLSLTTITYIPNAFPLIIVGRPHSRGQDDQPSQSPQLFPYPPSPCFFLFFLRVLQNRILYFIWAYKRPRVYNSSYSLALASS